MRPQREPDDVHQEEHDLAQGERLEQLRAADLEPDEGEEGEPEGDVREARERPRQGRAERAEDHLDVQQVHGVLLRRGVVVQRHDRADLRHHGAHGAHRERTGAAGRSRAGPRECALAQRTPPVLVPAHGEPRGVNYRPVEIPWRV